MEKTDRGYNDDEEWRRWIEVIMMMSLNDEETRSCYIQFKIHRYRVKLQPTIPIGTERRAH